MSLAAKRFLALGLSTAVALVAAWLLYPRAEPAPVVEFEPEVLEPEWIQRLRALDERDPPQWIRAFPDSVLLRERLPLETRGKLFGPIRRSLKKMRYDEHAYFSHLPDVRSKVPWPEHPDGGYRVRTNSAGLRMDREIRAEKPDLRVLITGDSHVDGVGNNAEMVAAQLEGLWAKAHPGETVEALNAGVGGYCAYNYIGVLEKYLELEPDAFVAVFYGGNDFADGLVYRHFFERTQRPEGSSLYPELMEPALEAFPGAVAQCFDQLIYLARNPGEVPLAVESAAQVLDEIGRICAHRGIAFVCVYLPPAIDVEWEHHREAFDFVQRTLELSDEDVRLTDRMAEELLAHLRGQGIRVLDAREVLAGAAAAGPHYWTADQHLAPAGHRRLAEALVPELEAALAEIGEGG